MNGMIVPVTITVQERFDYATLKPGESITVSERKDQLPFHVEAVDAHGALRFDEIVTWDELEDNDFRVVIR